MNLPSTCSGPQATSISVLFQSVTETADQWREEMVRKHKTGGGEEKREEVESDGGNGGTDQSF